MEQSKEFNRSVVVMPNMAISLWQTQTQGGRAYVENHAYRATPDKETETKN